MDQRILVVEDEIISQMVLYTFIKKIDNIIQVDIADNGKIALDLINNFTYNLIFMDLQMPVMDGYECIKKIRKIGYIILPIIVVSANAFDQFIEVKDLVIKPIEHEINKYINKPIEHEVIKDVLYEYNIISF